MGVLSHTLVSQIGLSPGETSINLKATFKLPFASDLLS